ncbi:MAG: Gfo/Idh/MocA family oxidoreductase [Bdellovibrionales bacterium]|nr:Gfo/Idh/MocA family oxidoreductase [Bdellovibrionales bacterium]
MIKAAVVGVGYLGTFHAEKYSRAKEAELVAVVDVDAERSRKLGRKLKAESLTDYRDLPSLGVQCASVVADTRRHFEIAAWLLERGIDVLVEKPMCATVEEARKLLAVAEEHGRILQVGHLERFNPAFREMKKLLTRPWFFEVRRISPFSGRGIDVDVVLDLMIHDIDIVSHLVGRPLEKVEAVGVPVLTESVDVANARLTFEGGAVANVSASRAAFKSERTIRIFQPEVYISLDYEKKKLKMYTKSGKPGLAGMPGIDVVEQKVEERDALNDEITSFIECVRTRTEPVVTGQDGLRALELADRIRSAFRESMALMGERREMARVGNAG